MATLMGQDIHLSDRVTEQSEFESSLTALRTFLSITSSSLVRQPLFADLNITDADPLVKASTRKTPQPSPAQHQNLKAHNWPERHSKWLPSEEIASYMIIIDA